MMIRGDWRYLRDDPPASRPFRTAMGLAAVILAVVWAVVSLALLGGLALWSF